MPSLFIPRNDGWNNASGHLNLSFLIEIKLPTGNSYDFSESEHLISWSKFNATSHIFSLISFTISLSDGVENAQPRLFNNLTK